MRVFVHTDSELKFAVFIVLFMGNTACHKPAIAFRVFVDKAVKEAIFYFNSISTAGILGFEFAFFFEVFIVVHCPIIGV